MRGKLVVIEGIDGSGKQTQWQLLVGRLGAVGVDFPRYKQSMVGKLLKKLLLTEDFQKLTPYVATLPFVLDQYLWWRDEGKRLIEEGKMVVANRYVTSNIHQIYKLTGAARNKFARWFWQLAYQELGLPRPDVVLVLDVKPEVARGLMRTRNNDQADRDWAYQLAAYRGYQQMCRREKSWVKVACREKNKLLTRPQISDRMIKILQDEQLV